MIPQLKKAIFQPLLALLAIVLLFSCQKDIDQTLPNTPIGTVPDFTSKVNSSVSGFVIDENNAAVIGASVKVGIATTVTDDYGFFEIKNVDVVKTAATVTVTKPGYFNGIKTFIAETNKSAFFRIKLIPKTTAGTINAVTGGNVTLPNGLIVALPANAVVNQAGGAAYSGTVQVAAYWIDPTSPELSSIMPGDLRALNTTGALQLLQSFGMAAVELTGTGGELLQIATGKKATLTLNIPAALAGIAPASIPLWYFDEALGLWKEEGSASKTGNTYVGEVSHFSFWNCDVPNNYVQFNCTIVDADGEPIPYAAVKISVVSNPNNAAWGYTDSTGYVAGAVPDNANLQLQVFSYYSCGSAIYSQNFSTTNTNISLGTITVISTTATANVSGTLTNCAGTALSNGAVLVLNNGQYSRYLADNTGAFNFNVILCNSTSASIQVIAEDYVAGQQSASATFVINSGLNNIGNLQACGVQLSEFITITANTSTDTYTLPSDSISYGIFTVTPPLILISGSRTTSSGGTSNTTFGFGNAGIGVGSIQNLDLFETTLLNGQTTITNPINVNITEYGAIGEFIAGNFNGVVTYAGTTNTAPISCSFRVRRTQ